MNTSEMKNSTTGNAGIKIDGSKTVIDNFNSTFNINTDSEKEPAKILSKVLNAEPILNQRRRQTFRENAPSYNDYAVQTGEQKDSLDLVKINADITKLCINARELKAQDTGKGTGLFLVPFKIANRSYCWTLLSKVSLTAQLKKATGERIAPTQSK